MAFSDAEASDAALTGISASLRDSLAEPTYARGTDQIYNNIDLDPLLTDFPIDDRPTSRVEVLQHIAPHSPELPNIRAAAVLFCRENQQQGPHLQDSNPIAFGRVQAFEALVNAITTSTRSLTPKKARALLRNVIQDAPPHLRLVRQIADLSDKPLSRYQMWSYLAMNPGNIFAEIGNTRAEAINVLGLGYHAPDTELVRWGHTLPVGVRAHQPTAWDAGADSSSVHWRPGGRTYKLDEDDYGVPELVHNPITGQRLSVPIEPLL